MQVDRTGTVADLTNAVRTAVGKKFQGLQVVLADLWDGDVAVLTASMLLSEIPKGNDLHSFAVSREQNVFRLVVFLFMDYGNDGFGKRFVGISCRRLISPEFLATFGSNDRMRSFPVVIAEVILGYGAEFTNRFLQRRMWPFFRGLDGTSKPAFVVSAPLRVANASAEMLPDLASSRSAILVLNCPVCQKNVFDEDLIWVDRVQKTQLMQTAIDRNMGPPAEVYDVPVEKRLPRDEQRSSSSPSREEKEGMTRPLQQKKVERKGAGEDGKKKKDGKNLPRYGFYACVADIIWMCYLGASRCGEMYALSLGENNLILIVLFCCEKFWSLFVRKKLLITIFFSLALSFRAAFICPNFLLPFVALTFPFQRLSISGFLWAMLMMVAGGSHFVWVFMYLQLENIVNNCPKRHAYTSQKIFDAHSRMFFKPIYWWLVFVIGSFCMT